MRLVEVCELHKTDWKTIKENVWINIDEIQKIEYGVLLGNSIIYLKDDKKRRYSIANIEAKELLEKYSK